MLSLDLNDQDRNSHHKQFDEVEARSDKEECVQMNEQTSVS